MPACECTEWDATVWRRTRHKARTRRNMGSTMNKAAVWTTCIALLAACSDGGDITPPPPPQATQMAASGGDGQTAQVGTALRTHDMVPKGGDAPPEGS